MNKYHELLYSTRALVTESDYENFLESQGMHFKKISIQDSEPLTVNVTVFRKWYQKIYMRKKKIQKKIYEMYQIRKVAGIKVSVEVR